MELYEDSPGSSEYSTGSTLLPQSTGDNLEHSLHQDIGIETKATQFGDKKEVSGSEKWILSTANLDQGKIVHIHDK